MHFDEIITSAVEKVEQSVVNISTVRLIRDQFFHVHPVQGIGSGVVIDREGIIVTNRHVVMESPKIVVMTMDRRKFSGSVIGSDATTDIAVVKVDAQDLRPAELGDSDSLKVGQLAIAIGNPFGFFLGGPTVTIGVVSALGRHIQTEDQVFEDLIQTDAAINPGNSGGPLVDSEGKVIGINTAMIPYAQGIGFAVPINLVKKVVNEILTYGRVVRPWLGIAGLSITNELASYYELPVSEGVLVASVSRGAPADRAGLQSGDIILAIDDVKVKSVEELQKLVQTKRVGSEVDVLIQRGHYRSIAKVVLGEVPQR
ncbi:MAG: trypsin-like peptidase domain-containing protein [Nitrososphaerota archaeon]